MLPRPSVTGSEPPALPESGPAPEQPTLPGAAAPPVASATPPPARKAAGKTTGKSTGQREPGETTAKKTPAKAPAKRAAAKKAAKRTAKPAQAAESTAKKASPSGVSRARKAAGTAKPAGKTGKAGPGPSGTTSSRRRTSVPAARTGTRRVPAPLPADDRRRLLSGSHHDPHALLGVRPIPDGLLVRVLRPGAERVTLVTEGGTRTELLAEGDGLFAAVLPASEPPGPELQVDYPGGARHTTADPYRFLPALGDFDLHLIAEGRHEELWRALGAEPMTHQGVAGTRFTVWAPNAQGVRVTGDFCCWDGTGYPMRSLGASGVWELFVPGLGAGTVYKFDVRDRDGRHTLRADPMARRAECPPNTASIVETSRYQWGDADWMAARARRTPHTEPMSVYEVHLPSWRPGLSYRELAEELPAYVRDLGFTHVELMPVAEHPFGGSWGYQVTGYYAPTARLGTPDDFRYLVDALHRAGIGVLMDWVPAHFPKDDWALAGFDGTACYEHPDPRRAEHPDWGTLEFNYGRTEVRNFLVANAVYWCQEFHLDGLRVDAVASMLYLDYSREDGGWEPNRHGGRENLEAVGFLQEMNATVYRRCPGVVTVAEESTAWDGVTRPTDQGGLGFGFKWNMGWMHDSLVYMSKDPVHRRYHHNEMTFSMVYAYSENYVLPISHDEVVHGKQALVSKMPGDWWQQRANHRAYLGFMWAHPGKQLLFMGQEFAQGAEWSECDGPQWWVLDPGYCAAGDHLGVRELVRDLNTRYQAAGALWQRDTDPAAFCWLEAGAAEDNVLAFVRHAADGTPLVAVSNFSPVVRHDYRLGVPGEATAWREVLNTDAVAYGGGGVGNPDPLKPESVPWNGRDTSVALTLPPLATLWLRPD